MSQREYLKEVLGNELKKLAKRKQVEKILDNIKSTFDKEYERMKIFADGETINIPIIDEIFQNLLVSLAIQLEYIHEMIKPEEEWKFKEIKINKEKWKNEK